jgi:hypothetical protein
MIIPQRIRQLQFLPINEWERGTIDFWQTDSKELFEQNLKTQPLDWYYRTNPIQYIVNDDGYRTQQFRNINWSESVVVFGCSQTFGIGLPEEYTIPNQLSSILNVPAVNMGIGASSISAALHNSIILKNGYSRPKAVVYLWPAINRTIYYHEDHVQNHGPWYTSPGDYFQLWNKTESHSISNALLAQMTVKTFWKDIPFYEATLCQHTASAIGCEFIIRIDRARDIMHPGIQTSQNIAKIISQGLYKQGFK